MADEHDMSGGEGEEPDGYEWVDLYPIYNAPDEPTAIHVCSLLTSAGIGARIRSAQVPWLDGLLANVVGYWGQVLVPLREVVMARALLEAVLAQIERDGGEGSQEDVGEGDEDAADSP